MSEFNTARRQGEIKFGYDFNTVAEVTRLWGLTATRLPYHNWFKIPGREDAICCLLSEKGGDRWENIPHRGLAVDGRGWHQIVRIDEVNSDPEKSAARVADELAKPLERYVFWRETRKGASWYKFHGVFKLDVAATQASLASGENACIYRKISDTAVCPQREVTVTEIPPADFKSYVGKVLEANLLDVVPCETSDPERPVADQTVWPGQKFLVTSVTPTSAFAVCIAGDGSTPAADVRFVIPKRDLELGFFVLHTEERKPLVELSEPVETDEAFEQFWGELVDLWSVSGTREELSHDLGKECYSVRCAWNEGTLVVALMAPGVREWDYAQMYRGYLGWDNIGDGFGAEKTRRDVAELLLGEIIKRRTWLANHPNAVQERARDLQEEQSSGGGSGQPAWFDEYRWLRNKTRELGEGDYRLYVQGVNKLWSQPIHCEWARADLRAQEEAEEGEPEDEGTFGDKFVSPEEFFADDELFPDD